MESTSGKDFKELDLTNLKALAYDLIASLEKNKGTLAAVNNEIARRILTPIAQTDKKEESKDAPK